MDSVKSLVASGAPKNMEMTSKPAGNALLMSAAAGLRMDRGQALVTLAIKGRFTVSDVAGRVVLDRMLGSGDYQIPISLGSGVYVARLESGGEILTTKVVQNR